jgi:hypothetical protein
MTTMRHTFEGQRYSEPDVVVCVEYPPNLLGRWVVKLESPEPVLFGDAVSVMEGDSIAIHWARDYGQVLNHFFHESVSRTIASVQDHP